MDSNLYVQLLTENTGKHLMDSGDAYGRHWEQNQGRNFEQEPMSTVSFKYGQIEYSLSLYHHLQDYTAEVSGPLAKEWREYLEVREEESGYEQMMGFAEYLEDQGYEVTGPFGGKPVSDNTYNGESCLDQQFQFLSFAWEGKTYVVLQVHGGCDIRGGYTDPVFLEVTEESFFFLSSGQIFCQDNPDHVWITDNGYNWESPGTQENLEVYPVEEVGENSWTQGKLGYTATGKGICPCCGGELKAE